MSLRKKISALKLPHYKGTAGMAAVRMAIPRAAAHLRQYPYYSTDSRISQFFP